MRNVVKTLLSRARLGQAALAAVVVGTLGLSVSTESQAVPAFARQTSMACQACHFPSFPTLNAFGRSFKVGGFTLTGAQEQIEDDGLSLPSVMNMSLITKFRYQKTNGGTADGTDKGEFQLPDEAALLVGGRVSENIGFLLEADLNGAEGHFLSFKVPVAFKGAKADFQITPFMTDALGAGYGLELLNTGALRSQRQGEDRSKMFAQQYLGLGAGAAEGVTFAAANPNGFVNATLFAPHHGNASGVTFAKYLRAAWTPTVGKWDAALGFQHYSGKVDAAEVDGVDLYAGDVKGWAIDGQMQGDLAGKPFGLYAAYGKVPSGSLINGTGMSAAATTTDKKAWNLNANWDVVPNKFNLILGYMSADNGKAVTAGGLAQNRENFLTLGAGYKFAQNVRLEVNHAKASGSYYDANPTKADTRTTVLLFSAF